MINLSRLTQNIMIYTTLKAIDMIAPTVLGIASSSTIRFFLENINLMNIVLT